MTMQLQEGSDIKVNCAKCGAEAFLVTLVVGIQRIKCTKYVNYSTFVKIAKNRDGSLTVETDYAYTG